jgi:PKD domain
MFSSALRFGRSRKPNKSRRLRSRAARLRRPGAGRIADVASDVERLEQRILLSGQRVAILIDGLGGFGPAESGPIINSLESRGFAPQNILLENWNSFNPNSTEANGQKSVSGNPGGFNVNNQDVIYQTVGGQTIPQLGIPSIGVTIPAIQVPSMTIPTNVGVTIDIGTPNTPDQFVAAASQWLTSNFDSNDHIVIMGYSLGGASAIELARAIAPLNVDLLATLDPVGYAPTPSINSTVYTPNPATITIPILGSLPLPATVGFGFDAQGGENADGNTPGFRSNEFGGGLPNVSSNVANVFNRYQTNGPFPMDFAFPGNGPLSADSPNTNLNQSSQNTTAAYSASSDPLDWGITAALGEFNPSASVGGIDLDPFTYTTFTLFPAVPNPFDPGGPPLQPAVTETVPTGLNTSDWLMSNAQQHSNFYANPDVDNALNTEIDNIIPPAINVAPETTVVVSANPNDASQVTVTTESGGSESAQNVTPVNGELDFVGVAPQGQSGGGDMLIIDTDEGSLPSNLSMNFVGIGSGNSVVGPDLVSNSWTITGENIGRLDDNLLSFSGVQSLVGGIGSDNFQIWPDGQLDGSLIGGANGTLDYSQQGGPIQLDIGSGSAPGVIGSVSGISNIIGTGNPNDVLMGPNATWDIGGLDSGSVDGVTFSAFANIEAGTGTNDFAFLPTGYVSSIKGGGGSDTLDYSQYGAPATVNLQVDMTTTTGTFSGMTNFIGASNYLNEFVGPDATWTITGLNSGTVDGTTYSDFQYIFGGAGDNQFIMLFGGGISGSIEGGAGTNTLDYSEYPSSVFINLQTDTAPSLANFSNIQNLIGGPGENNEIFGPDTSTQWILAGHNSVFTGGLSFRGFQILDGGSGGNSVTIVPGAALDGPVNGGAGNNTLIATEATWDITGANSGTVSGITFQNFQNLTGNGGPNDFVLKPGGSETGTVNGGPGTNTLDFSQSGASVSVDLATDFSLPVANFTNIENIIGGTAPNLLVGPNTDPVWNLTGHNAGSVGGINFTNFQTLEGGTDGSTFLIGTAGSVDGFIEGGNGTNILNYSTFSGNVFVDLLLNQATAVAQGVFGIQNVVGANGNSLIVGDDSPSVLTGGTGRNLLIADGGADTLIGGTGDNILIGDPTIYDSNATALQALFAEWTRTNLNFNQRMSDLVALSRGSLNGSDLLTPFTVTAGGNSDSLIDGPGLNWNLITVGQDSVTIAEGQSLTLSPSAVAPTSGTLSYAWNLNGNGNYNQASGSDTTLTWSQLNALGINDGPETFQMRLRVINGRTSTTSNPSTLSITPVNPTATLSNGGTVAQGSPATVSFGNQFDPSPVETAAGFLYSYDFLDNGTFEVVNSKSPNAVVPASDLLTVGPHIVHARITEAKGGKFTDYYTTINVVASLPTVSVGTPIPTSVSGEPVPLVIRVSDTSTTAQAASFNFAVSFGDGDTTTFAGTTPVLVTHTYTQTGTYVVQVTATDEYGNVSVVATQTIKVVPVAVEADPFHPGETALFVGGTSGNDTVGFAASGRNIAVTLNGVSEGTFSANGSLIVFGQGGTDVVHEGSGLKNPTYLLESLTTDNIETDLDNEALQWAGLKSALEILNV